MNRPRMLLVALAIVASFGAGAALSPPSAPHQVTQPTALHDCHPPAPASQACLKETVNQIVVYKELERILADIDGPEHKVYSPEEIVARITAATEWPTK
jgi:hypothetical protein